MFLQSISAFMTSQEEAQIICTPTQIDALSHNCQRKTAILQLYSISGTDSVVLLTGPALRVESRILHLHKPRQKSF